MSYQYNFYQPVIVPEYVNIVINNTDYYYMVENQVRTAMKNYEVGVLLGLAEKIYKKFEIDTNELISYPTEGYYNETPNLRRYFNLLRNLQHNPYVCDRVKECPEVAALRRIVCNELFGEFRKDKYKQQPENSKFKRRYDLVTITMNDDKLFNSALCRPWTIKGIMDGCKKHYKGRVNLVELAFLTGDARTVCAATETNALSRMYGALTGCFKPVVYEYNWDVSPNVEQLGREVVLAYNKLIHSEMKVPTIHNFSYLDQRPKLPRKSLLGKVLNTKENYYWIINENNILTDKYEAETQPVAVTV